MSDSGHRCFRTPTIAIALFFAVLFASPCGASRQPSPEAHAGTIEPPLFIDISVEEASIRVGNTTIVRAVLRAGGTLDGLYVDVATSGAASLVGEREFHLAEMEADEEVVLDLSVRFTGVGFARVGVEVSATIRSIDYDFTRSAILNALVRADDAFAAVAEPIELKRRAIERDRAQGVLSDHEADLEIRRLTELGGRVSKWPVPSPSSRPAGEHLLEGIEPSAARAAAPGTPAVQAARTVRVTGTITWQDEDATSHAMFAMTVEVWDEETGADELVTTTVTDIEGVYDVTIDNDDGIGQGGRDIYVKVFTSNSMVDVKPPSLPTYEKTSGVEYDVDDGSTVTNNFTFGPPVDGKAASVFQGMTWIATYAKILNGGSPLPLIDVIYPEVGDVSYYDGNLHIIGLDRWDWDVQHHEYGHYVMDHFDFESSPGGDHCIGDCLSLSRCGIASTKEIGVPLAWNEGWATYFAISGQNSTLLGLGPMGDMGMAALGVPRVGDVNFTDSEDSTIDYSLEQNSNDIGGGGML